MKQTAKFLVVAVVAVSISFGGSRTWADNSHHGGGHGGGYSGGYDGGYYGGHYGGNYGGSYPWNFLFSYVYSPPPYSYYYYDYAPPAVYYSPPCGLQFATSSSLQFAIACTTG
jgi:hypothetical protein